MNQYLIAANTKRGQLIFNVFRPIDLGIISTGTAITFILFLIFQPDNLYVGVAVLLPFLICAFLVLPIPNYHNVLCILQNVWRFYFKDENELVWKGWCAKDEYKD
jgi:hypothetical protein